jgi:hypothetical protein
MSDRIKNTLLGVAVLASLALGGSAVAGAVSGNQSGAAASGSGSGSAQAPPAGAPRHAGETALTGSTADGVRKAALAKTGGGTIERVETDSDGNAAYEAHITKSDGSRVTVYVDKQFNVVGVDQGR